MEKGVNTVALTKETEVMAEYVLIFCVGRVSAVKGLYKPCTVHYTSQKWG